MNSNEFFGSKAGIVWGALKDKKSMTVHDIGKATKLRAEHVYGALGWLAREGKIGINGNRFFLTE
ncbi:MAG: winged helix-turn-helix domain-containing protein [Candidatus Diapherotrites archaeon]